MQYWLHNPSRAFLETVSDSGKLAGVVLSEPDQWHADELQRVCDLLNDRAGRVALEMGADAQKPSEILALAERVDRANFMVSLRPDDAGIATMQTLVAEGVSVQARALFSPARAAQVAETIAAHAASGAAGMLVVPVGPFDRELNAPLKAKGLAQNRIGFFVAQKIYNHIEAMGDVPLEVMFGDVDVTAPEVEETYYLHNLALPGAHFLLSPGMYQKVADQTFEESFHFQTRHLDAFFGYLAPAGISLGATQEALFAAAV